MVLSQTSNWVAFRRSARLRHARSDTSCAMSSATSGGSANDAAMRSRRGRASRKRSPMDSLSAADVARAGDRFTAVLSNHSSSRRALGVGLPTRRTDTLQLREEVEDSAVELTWLLHVGD